MPTKQILFNEESKKAVLKGMDIATDAIVQTLGAKGKTVVIGSKSHTKTSKDGVTVARSIRLEDTIEAIGANAIRDVAQSTVNACGDNTTTASLLTRAIYKEGIKLISAGYNSVELKKGIDSAVSFVIDEIKKQSKEIYIDSDKLKQVASISANNDELIGGYVAEAIKKTGKDGVVTVEGSNTDATYVSITEGIEFDRSYLSYHYINNFEKLSCELEEPYILVAEGKLSSEKDVFDIFKQVADKSKPFLVITEFIDGAALSLIEYNRIKGKYPVCVVKAPSFGENQKRMLQDIAIVVGADVASDNTGMRPDLFKLTNLGTAKKVIVTKDKTTIIGGHGKKHDIESHIKQVRTALELSSNELERKQNEDRLAKLIGGVGIIYVGGSSEIEISEKFDRYDDSLRASKCALIEGVCAGGGTAYLRSIEKLNSIECDNDDQKAGIKVIQKALEQPFIQMAKNAGLENRISISEILKGGENYGYNFKTDKFENLYESGVVDAAMVLRVALKNAASVAGTLLTSEVLIVNEDTHLPNLPK